MRQRYGIGFRAPRVPRSSADQRRRVSARTVEARRAEAPANLGSNLDRRVDAPR
jgi:hypothetical protein